ncbi:MAG: IPT/TIG domain-containing protein [Methanoregula sp.]|nr:IPT/TIG domain-containing protein [Methanoregula sp.]
MDRAIPYQGGSDEIIRRFRFFGIACIAIVLLFALVGLASAASVPKITGLSPSGGPITGGTVVIVTGSGFSGTTDVRFGGKSGAGLNIVNDSRLTVTTPPNPEGTVPVSVINAAGTGNSMDPSTMYEYDEYPFPRVSEVSPSSGPVAGNTLVTITGSGFTDIEDVQFGGKYAWVQKVVDDSHLTVRTPASSPGSVPISMTNAHGAVRSTDPAIMYTYEFPLPALSGISPSSGSPAGGTVVSITGSGFSGATDVKFGVTSGIGLTVTDDSHLTIISPPGAEGTVALSVINPAWTGSSPGSATVFRYEVPVPKLTWISPPFGSVDGGTVVNITGSGFTGTTDVQFGGKSGTELTVINDCHLSVITPASSPGSFPVSITNTYGTGGSLRPSTSFRYVISPSETIAVTKTTASPVVSFPTTSPELAVTTAADASGTRKTPGFGAIAGLAGLAALGAVILLRKNMP